MLDYPHYTRPADFNGIKVPDVLISGNHKKIEEWRIRESLKRTYIRRKDLLEKKDLSNSERKILNEIIKELEGQNNEK